MPSATQIGAYAKFAPEQKTTMLAILLGPSADSGQLALSLIVIIIGHGALMPQVHDDVNVPV